MPFYGKHFVTVEEVGDGIFQIRCSCGLTKSTPWGIEAATKIATQLHQDDIAEQAKREILGV